MCGIAGLIHRGKSGAIGQEMTAMLEALKHRGPDSTGFALYGEPQKNELIMRLKLAEQEETRKGFDIHKKLPERRQEVDRRIVELGGKVDRCRRGDRVRLPLPPQLRWRQTKAVGLHRGRRGRRNPVARLRAGADQGSRHRAGSGRSIQADEVQRHARHRPHADGDRIRRRHQVGAPVLGVPVRRRVGGAQRPADELLDGTACARSARGIASCPTAIPN